MVRGSADAAGSADHSAANDAGETEQPIRITFADEDDGGAGEVINVQRVDDGPANEVAGETGRIYTDPESAVPPKRRGRPPGSRNASRKPKSTPSAFQNSETLERTLIMLHAMGSALLHEPELAIDGDEAKLLSDALTKTAVAFDWGAVVSPKTQALIELSIVCGTVYGPRVMKVAARRRKPGKVVSMAAQAPQPMQGNPFNPQPIQ